MQTPGCGEVMSYELCCQAPPVLCVLCVQVWEVGWAGLGWAGLGWAHHIQCCVVVIARHRSWGRPLSTSSIPHSCG